MLTRVAANLLNALVLNVTFAAIGFYALYWVVRVAVRHGIRDARAQKADSEQ
jgi:hypothetical protein